MLSRLLVVLIPTIAAAAVDRVSPFAELFFEPNLGQSSPSSQFLARAPGARLSFEADGVRIASGGATVVLRFPGATLPARFEPLDATPDRSFYFFGRDESRWTRDVPHYRRLAWRGVYPGVDAIFYGSDGRLEYDLVVAPGADTDRIRVRFDGARVAIGGSGALVVGSGAARFEMLRPRVYQSSASGERREIGSRYRRSGRSEVRFEVDAYDRARELVVDPVLQFASYHGAERDDSVVAVTAQGDIVGVTSSSGFSDGKLRGGKDIFAMVSFQSGSFGGTALLVTGGSDDDVPTCAAGDGSGLIIGGWSRSTDFLRTTNRGGSDGFLLYLSRGQFQSPFATLVGGSGDDRINGVFGASTVFYAGETNSTDLRIGDRAAAGSYGGGVDVMFGYAFRSTPSTLAYYGGSGDDRAFAVINDTGTMSLAGRTTSTDLPLKDPISAQLAGTSDAFVARFLNVSTPNAFDLFFASYFGGSGEDEIRGLSPALSAVTFAGTTTSTDLPVLNAAMPQYAGGASDAFVGRLDYTAKALVYSTYLGGSGRDESAGISYNNASDNVVVGTTTSPDLPVAASPAQDRLAGAQDAWYAAITLNGAIQTLSYFGGSGSDRALAMALSVDNILTIGGETDSPDLPALTSAPGAGLDGYTARFALPRVAAGGPTTIWIHRNFCTWAPLFLSASAPEDAVLTIESSNPSVALVGLASDRLAASVSIPARGLGNQGRYTFCIAGEADAGEAEVTATVSGVGSQKFTTRMGPLAVQALPSFLSPPSYFFDETVTLAPSLGVMDDAGRWQGGQLRPGVPSPIVTYSISDESMATLNRPTYTFGDPNYILMRPRAAGEVVVSASVEGAALAGPSNAAYRFKYPTVRVREVTIAKDIDIGVSFDADRQLNFSTYQVDVSTDSPDKICFVSGGDCASSATVTGLSFVTVRGLADSGSAIMRISGPRVNSSDVLVNLAPAKLMFGNPGGPSGTLTVGFAAGLNIFFGVGQFTGTTRAGLNPRVTLVSSDPKVLSVSAGNSSTSFILQPLAPGTATLRASSPGFIDSDPVEIRVAAVPGRQLNPSVTEIVLGQNLQTTLRLNSGPPLVRAKSSAPDLVAVSPDFTRNGSAEADSTTGSFALQGLSASGSATITLSSEGYADAVVSVRLTPSGFAWAVTAASVAPNSSASLRFGVYALDPDTLAPVTPQTARPGLSPIATVTSSDPRAGTASITTSPDARFDSRDAGSTVVTLEQPAGFTAPSVRGSIRVNVVPTAPRATMPSYLGRDMQFPVTFDAGPAKFTLRSDDPARLLLSKDPKSMGTAEVEIAPRTAVYLQALAADGPVRLRAVAEGIADVVYAVVLVPGAVELTADAATYTTFSPDFRMTAALAYLAPIPVYLSFGSAAVSIRPGLPPLEVGISSSDSTVARPLASSVTFTPGTAATATFNVRPQQPGEAVIRLSVPAAFHGSDALEQKRVTIRRPRFQPTPLTIGRDQMARLSFSPDVSLPGTILVTLVSSDPSRVLLSTSASQAGQPRVTVTMGQSSSFGTEVFVHGIAEGTAYVTVSATDFDETRAEVTVVKPKVFLSSIATALIGRDTELAVTVDANFVRPGAQFRVNLTSSDPAIATVTPTVVIEAGQQSARAIVAARAEGRVTITADAGDVAPDSRLSVTVRAEVPPLPFASLPTSMNLGRGLQAPLGFQPTSSGQVRLTVTSTDPSKVLLSTDPKALGSASVTLTVGSFASVYVQALADAGDIGLILEAAGYVRREINVSLYPSTLLFDRSVATLSRGNTLEFAVVAGPLLPQNLSPAANQTAHTAVSFSVASSRPEVGSLRASSATIAAGENRAFYVFTSTSAGTTTMSLTLPAGFLASTPPAQMVIVVN